MLMPLDVKRGAFLDLLVCCLSLRRGNFHLCVSAMNSPGRGRMDTLNAL